MKRVALILTTGTSEIASDIVNAVPSPLTPEPFNFIGTPEAAMVLAARLGMSPPVDCVVILPGTAVAEEVASDSNRRAKSLACIPKAVATALSAVAQFPHVFSVVFSKVISQDPAARFATCSLAKCHMVTHVLSDLRATLTKLSNEQRSGTLQCPVCLKSALSPIELREHLPMYHVNSKKTLQMRKYPCPICKDDSRESIVVHVHDEHAPPGVHVESGRSMPQVVSFGLCVIQRKSDKKFLVVQEYENQGFWLPGGGIDGAEMPHIAAQRECLEEAGIHANLTGLLRVEVSPPKTAPYMRLRYIFYGHPVDENEDCKTFPDFESVGACWVSIDDLNRDDIEWRGDEPHEWFRYVANGGLIAPLETLTREGAPAHLIVKPALNIN